MRTILRSYSYDISTPADKAAYAKLVKTLKATPGRGRWMKSHGGGSHYNSAWQQGVEVTFDPKCLFANQWNIADDSAGAPNYRVFDWAEDAIYSHGSENTTTKRGHYLEITDEMREVRRNTHKCRYCGKMEPAQKGYIFCPHCRGSEHLKKSDLYLTRMMAIDDESDCAPLTEAAAAHLVPLWEADQLGGASARGQARLIKEQKVAMSRRDGAIRKANNDYELAQFCLDNGFLPEIVILYDHTGRCVFGWSTPLSADQVSKLLDCVSECPFPYSIKCADGKTIDDGRGEQ